MKNPILNDIVEYARKRLMHEYGYCGVASADDMAMLNSDDKAGRDITISIKSKESA